MPADDLDQALNARFGEVPEPAPELSVDDRQALARIAARRSHRAFTDDPVSPELVRLLAATALSAPSKSDLQQADIVVVRDRAKRDALADIVPAMPWVRTAPAFVVLCADNRRIRQVCAAQGHPFANDHLDAFFNASVDAGILLAFLVQAAESVGLGCCPVSVLRNRSAEVSAILELPDHVFAVAGLALGWPAEAGAIVPRLGLASTLHEDSFADDTTLEHARAYDARRRAARPYRGQRQPELYGTASDYGWMEEKARHYASPERADFGAFIRAKGFRLD